MNKIIVTGCSGFIGMHICESLLKDNFQILGLDNMNDYYSVKLKKNRLKNLKKYTNFKFENIDISNLKDLNREFKEFCPDKVVNLAAQAGVRYSITNPHEYIESNIVGFMNILECCRNYKIKSLIYASSSSVYGKNEKLPFSTNDNTDRPLSIYAATKKSNELMAFSYNNLYGLNTTGLRFFTVYGPWGRPDMAYFKFTKNILDGKKINIFNKGKMYRDYTFIDDVVEGIYKLSFKIPKLNPIKKYKNDSLSHVAPFRVFNVGNTKKVLLLDFISTLEKILGKKAKKKYLPMQKGDVYSTLSDISLLQKITSYKPKTKYQDGIKKFLNWYKSYYC